MDNTDTFIIGGIIGFVLGVFLTVGCSTPDVNWHKDAVAHGAAHYDQTTGAFTWNK